MAERSADNGKIEVRILVFLFSDSQVDWRLQLPAKESSESLIGSNPMLSG